MDGVTDDALGTDWRSMYHAVSLRADRLRDERDRLLEAALYWQRLCAEHGVMGDLAQVVWRSASAGELVVIWPHEHDPALD